MQTLKSDQNEETVFYSEAQVKAIIESLETGIQKLGNKAKQVIYEGEPTNNLEDFQDFIRECNTCYALMKQKFSTVLRDDGDRYFEHLRAVANIILDLPGANTRSLLVALLHDAIEDTDIDYNFIKVLVGEDIAIAVQAISKNPRQEYFKDDQEEVSVAELKKRRNEEYFGHMKSFESMKQYLASIASENEYKITDEELTQLTIDTINVKLADRIHNLSTQWDMNNLEKVKRKVEETETYFLEIAREINPAAYETIQVQLFTLKAKLVSVSKKVKTVIDQ